MRVTILGHTGSGKTTLAKAISKQYGIPHIQIDRFWFRHGGGKLKPDDNWTEVRKKVHADVRKAIRQKDWVSDGIYPRVQPEILKRADVVIYMDVPLRSRLVNHAKRMTKRHNRHDEVSFTDDLKHFVTIVKKTPKHRNTIQLLIKDHPRVILLRGRKEISRFREKLPESLDRLLSS